MTRPPAHGDLGSHAVSVRLTQVPSTFRVSPRLRARAQTTVPGHVTTNQGRTWDKGEGGGTLDHSFGHSECNGGDKNF